MWNEYILISLVLSNRLVARFEERAPNEYGSVKKRSFIHLLVEVVKDAQIRTSFGNSKLDILFQICPVTKKAAARTMSPYGDDIGL